MTRPDALLLVAVSGLFKFVSIIAALREGRTDAFRVSWNVLLWAVAFAVLFAPYFAWRYAYYDELLPNTYYAKVGSGLDQYERGLYHLAIFAREHAAWLLVVAPIAIAFGGVRRPAAMYVLGLVLVWFAYVTYIGGDSLVRFRFFAPLLPLMYALVASSGLAIVRAVRVETAPRMAMEAPGVLAAAALLMFTLQSSATDGAIAPEREAVEDRAEIGRWLRASLPETTLIAVIPAGAIPYESRLRTIDMLGINDKHIAHRDLDLGTFGAGHEKYDSQYVLDRQPDIIILMDTLAERAWRREDYDVLRGGIIPARIDMLSTPRLWEEYEARAVRLREGAWLNLLVRRDASAVREKTQAP
jgi:arabinofuranosyltransferase